MFNLIILICDKLLLAVSFAFVYVCVCSFVFSILKKLKRQSQPSLLNGQEMTSEDPERRNGSVRVVASPSADGTDEMSTFCDRSGSHFNRRQKASHHGRRNLCTGSCLGRESIA